MGAGTCITIAPTAFDWYRGDFSKAGVADATSVEDEVLREAALACPTGAIVVEEIEELLPWQLARPRRRPAASRRRSCSPTSSARPTSSPPAEGSEIIASKETAAGSRFPVSEPRTVTLRGTSEPEDVVSVEWR